MEHPEEYDDIKTNHPILSNLCKKAIQKLIDSINWKEGDVIMDYGCGSGQFISESLLPIAEKKKAKIIYGVDISKTMIEYAKTNYSGSAIVDFSVGNLMDSNNWTFMDGSIDKFISCFVLCYFEDYREFFAKVAKLLKLKGQVGFVVPFAKSNGIANKLFEDSEKWSEYQHETRIAKWVSDVDHGTPNFCDELTSLGLKIICSFEEEEFVDFKNLREICEFVNMTSGASNGVPDHLKEEMMKDMIDTAEKYLNISKTQQDIQVKWKYAVVVAEKLEE